MAFDEMLAARIRTALHGARQIQEKRMFGGIAFMHRGYMACGVVGNELMVRVGPDGYDAALRKKHVRPMDFTGKPLKGMVYVAFAGLKRDADLYRWIRVGLDFTGSLPPKKSAAKKASTKKTATSKSREPRRSKRGAAKPRR